jgi:hypothetical protein
LTRAATHLTPPPIGTNPACPQDGAAAEKLPSPSLASDDVADEHDKPLSEQLEEIRTQVDWVRDYL